MTITTHHKSRQIRHADNRSRVGLTRRTLALVSAFITLLLFGVSPVFATGALSLTVSSDAPPTLETGETFDYLINFSCAGVTGNCGNLTVTVPYDPSVVDIVNISTDLGAGYTSAVLSSPDRIEITKTGFNDGDSSQATIRFRAKYNLPTGGTVPTTSVSATITTPAGPLPPPVVISQVPIDTPTEQWSARKTVTLPNSINPAPDSYVRYNVQYCSDSATGNISIPNAVLVDVLPNGAVIRNSAAITAGGGVIDLVSSPRTIRWDLGPQDIATILNGCITRIVELEFPSANGFSVGQVQGNTVYGYTDDPGPGPYDGTCIAPCTGIGGTTTNVTLDTPQAAPSLSKDGPGSTVITNPGISRFNFGFNLANSNVDLTNVTLRENIPLSVDTPGTPPSILITRINSGAWSVPPPDVNPIADVYVSTDNGGTFTYVGTANGVGTTWNAGVDFPTTATPVTNIEWRFTTLVPMGFSFSSRPFVEFTPNPGLVGSDYEDPAPGTQNYRQYQNCITVSYVAGTNPLATTAPRCSNVRISSESQANVEWSKGASPSSNINGGDIVTFTLNMALTPQSSGSLINPFYEDTLDGVLEFINWDNTNSYTLAGQKFEITFQNTDGSDTVNNPYLFVDTPLPGQTRLRFFWTSDNAYPLTAGSYRADGSTNGGGETNTLIFTQPPSFGTDKIATIRFRARVSPTAIAGAYSNGVTVATNSPGLFCQTGTATVDTGDIDGDGDTTEVICNTSTNFNVREVATVEAFKWVRSTLNPTNNVRSDLEPFDSTFVTNPDFNCTSPLSGEVVILPDAGGDYARTPCVAQGNPGEPFDYKLQITNRGNIRISNFILYDILPYIGDVGVSQATFTQARLTEFPVWLSGPISVSPAPFAAAVVVEYNTSTNPCRPEMSNTADEVGTAWFGGCSAANDTWLSAAGVSDWRTIRSFRIRQVNNAVTIDPNDTVTIDISGRIPSHTELTAFGDTAEASRALTREIAWNNFAYRFTSSTTGNRLLTAEPRKVGIRIPDRLSVGNRVWIDNGNGTISQANNRVRNGSENGLGVDGVELHLYRYDGPDAGFNSSNFNLLDPNIRFVATTTTANGGYYLFEQDNTYAGAPYDWLDQDSNLANGTEQLNSLRPGRYFIYIPPTNFDNIGDPLFGYISSTGIDGSATTDDRDRGFDNGLGASVNPAVNGVRSNWFSMQYNTTPTGETDRLTTGVAGPYGRGNYFQKDQHSDLIRDFGFVQVLSIGNRVWYDTGAGTNNNNGVFDGDESGVANVTVRLYRVQGGTGNPVYNGDGTPAIQTGFFNSGTFSNTYNPVTIGGGGDYLQTTTNAQGYYQFETLPPGNYVVFLPQSNFTFATAVTSDAVLATYANSTGNTATDGIANPSTSGTAGTFGDGDDSRDKGIENNFLATNGVYSPVVHLRPENSQTTAETDLGTRQHGLGVANENSNLTADFGFYQPPMSLGNRVWRDYNNNGIQDAGEPGLEGVVVEIFYDENGDGIPDDGVVSGPTNATLLAPGAPLQTLTTDVNGYYRFDNLRPGRYVVRVSPDNFDSSGTNDALVPFVNTTVNIGTENVDMNDNGITPANQTLYSTVGVYSGTVQLVPVSEPNHTADGAHSGVAGTELDLGTGQGTGGDRNTDLTVDFGFYRPSSIGNRVWLDDGNGTPADPVTGIPTGFNNGVQDGNEPNQGIAGVRVELWRDANGDSTFDPLVDTFIGFDTTDANGYYLFDNLPDEDANYFVFLPPSNFDTADGFGNDPLDQYTNSRGQFTNDDDRNDNGTYFNYPTENGIVSNVVAITPRTNPTGFAPIGEAELSGNTDPLTGDGTNSRGRYNESDDHSNLTIDFGFIPTKMSLGNRVWRDYNNNAVQDAGEPPIANVILNLYTVTAGVPTQVAGSPIATTTTDANGYYIFDNLLPGEYIVTVAPSNFTNTGLDGQGRQTGILENLTNSNNLLAGYNGADNQTDLDDNGRDTYDTGYGFMSVPVTLAYRTEPVSETRSGNNAHGNPDDPDQDFIGNQLQLDNDSDLTIDFGFYLASSIGNRVWLDDGNGTPADPVTGIPTGFNNGVQDGNEPNQGFAGVRVELWRDANGDDVFDPLVDTFLRFDTTDANGYYLFDGLEEVDHTYFTFLPPSNFDTADGFGNDPLDQYTSSRGQFTNNDDRNDNGTYFNYPTENGIISNPIEITPRTNPTGFAPIGETELSGDVLNDGANSRGRFNEGDPYSNLTIDFGFIPTKMSLGNRVWRDHNNNAVQDAGEPPIANVILNLYTVTAGVPTQVAGSPIATTTTDANGYYIFDNLLPGEYIVTVAPSNFTNTGLDGQGRQTGILENLTNSNNLLAGYNGADNQVDLDDNGRDTYDTGYGFMSVPVTLAYRTEPVSETRSGNNAHGNPDDPDQDFIGNQLQLDNDSDLTIDFGFYLASSIGNRVWLDDGNGTPLDPVTGIPVGFNNGVQDGNEPNQGFAGVRVELWRDMDGDNVFNIVNDLLIRFDTTDANGYYLFDGLEEVDHTYFVVLPPSNFNGANGYGNDPLDQYTSSRGQFTNDDDRNDNGVYFAYPTENGIISNPIEITPRTNPTGFAPLGETELSGDVLNDGANSRGRFNEGDPYSNLTVDFGFVRAKMSLGNRVWQDYNNNAVWNTGEPGLQNVILNLYTVVGGVPVEPANLPLATTTTDANGYYIFDNLFPGEYIVTIAPSNFTNTGLDGQGRQTGILENFTNSNNLLAGYNGADNQVDLDDNGRDTYDTSYGFMSVPVVLSYRTEPINEERSNNPAHGNPDDPDVDFIGNQLQLDNDSDLTIDFGFYRPSSIGNRVWLDNGAGTSALPTGVLTGFNNATQDGNEPNQGIAGVRVDLYRDNGDGTFDSTTDTFIRTDTTDANGYYLFDGLEQVDSDYFVWIHPSNFNLSNGVGNDPLDRYDNSYGQLTNNDDRNDNGADVNYPEVTGIVSNLIEMTPRSDEALGFAPIGETELSGDVLNDGVSSRGRFNEADNFSNLTIDFGFHEPLFSIGNRLWYDLNNNGLWETGEAGVPDARVYVYRDGGNGTFDFAGDTQVAVTLTDSNGYYLFDNLPAGNYFVWVDEFNFRNDAPWKGVGIAGPLLNYFSSQPTTTTDNNVDQDDNGIYAPDPFDATPVTGGVVSPMITLSKNTEPITDTELSNNPVHDDGTGTYRGTRKLDSNSDLTIDFGFYKPMSLGNRVWYDTNGDGIIDATENGIGGVTLELWVDTNNDGTPDAPYQRNTTPGMVNIPPTTAPYTVTTDVNGWYLFDNLVPGNYIVVIPGAQVPLAGLNSTTDDVGGSSDLVDNNDNGIGTGNAPVQSRTIQLVLDNEPTNEIGLGPQGIGANGEENRNSNVTVDFGFTAGQMSLGNRVWLDPNNNGMFDTGELGIANVVVNLYRDTNNDSVPDGAVVATDTTDANGYYLFDGLAPGRYIVALPNSNFNTSQPLNGLVSSVDQAPPVNAETSQTDQDDNGLDALHPTFGLMSQSILLELGLEAIGELDLSNNAADGAPGFRGTIAKPDENSDLTIDFGLFRPLSLGNRVWYDLDNDGRIDSAENGIGGVIVNLYRDNGDGVFNPALDTLIGTDTTDSRGYYLFDRLGQGDYFVVVDPSNFNVGNPLEALDSSTPTFADNADNNDNGINNGNPPVDNPVLGVVSNRVTLAVNTAPLGESDLSLNPLDGTNYRGNNGETDRNSNLTIDFGFVGAPMSLGNRVWIDDGGTTGTALDGIQNGDEAGVPNVRVSLYRDDNSDGVPDGTAVASTTTNSQGYYLFDNLTPGNYVVGLDATNFNGSGALVGYGSTLTTANPAEDDQRDNGLDPNDPPVNTRIAPNLNGILSNTVTLVLNNEPITETDIATPPGIGANGINNNSNLTVDFGVYRFLSIGNRVWFDADNSGTQNGTEVGIPNVTVRLYNADPATGLPTGGHLAEDVTDANGYYLFDRLLPGNYVVAVTNDNFLAGNPLFGMGSSSLEPAGNLTGEQTTDRNDNGFNLNIPEGIISNMFTLAYSTMPTNETDLSGNVGDGITDPGDGPNFRGRFGEANNNSNLTVDFGFFANTMSLGNRVWLDDGGTTGTPNNGVQDGDEAGIPNVIVRLFADPDGDGVPNGSAIGTQTTDTNGYYLFDNLPPGRYVVVVAPENFQTSGALVGLNSSNGNNITDADINDNGIDNPAPTGNGIRSNSIHLVPSNAPLGETDFTTPPGIGAGGDDSNSNITVDFGFTRQFDLSDAPNSYGTQDPVVDNAGRHQIIPNLYMGRIVDDEVLGSPSVGADGDDTSYAGNPIVSGSTGDDEDGVIIPRFVVGTTQTVEVTVFNNTGQNAILYGWVDFDGDGVFEVDADTDLLVPGPEGIEWASAIVPSSPTPQIVYLTFVVPTGADVATGGFAGSDGSTYARFRLSLASENMQPTDSTGTFLSGEIEDYVVPQVSPPGVAVTKTNNQNAIVAGQSTTYTITIANSSSNIPVTGINVQDIVDTGVNAFLPGSITWTCRVDNGGLGGVTSCLTGLVAPTNNGVGNINEFIDLDTGGVVVFELTATLNPAAANAFVSNTATVTPNGGTSTDIDGIIFDPPNGVKTGQVLGNNVIRWTMVWFNTGAAETATVSDVVSANQTFAGNLVCTAFGTSNTSSCTFDAVTRTVSWTGLIDTGNPNRVEIAFDVLIPGDGVYTNTGNISLGGGAPSTSTGTVTIGTPQTQGPGMLDPTIVKLVDPNFAQPGELVRWEIQVFNPNTDGALPNIGFTDTIDSRMTIIEATSTIGTVTIDGQNVTFFTPALQAQEVADIIILTRVRPDADVPFIIENVVTLDFPYEDLSANAVVLNVKELPATGETPFWRVPVLVGGLASLIVAVGVLVIFLRRRASRREE